MKKLTYDQVQAYEAFKAELCDVIQGAVANTAGNTTVEEDVEIADAVLRALLDGGWLDLPEYEEE